ncbi:MAG TPA: hypothetical protein DDZ90_05810 [Planctomycetaceae bacterium]|nr:hypothetical protein [Planctomycetaceae bacterium]
MAGNGGAENSATGGEASTGWFSLVDPPRVSTDWTADPALSIDLKERDDNFITPNAHSPYIGIKAAAKSIPSISVWNLATGEEINTLSLELPGENNYYNPKVKLSSDGKTLLATARNAKTKISKLASFDVSSGKVIATWEAGPAETNVSTYEFCGPSKVFIKTLRKENTTFIHEISLWDLQSGKQIKDALATSNHNDFNSFAYRISPGGKYLIAGMFRTLSVYDLSSLELVKKIELLKLVKAADPGNIVSDTLSVIEKAFSDDGTELALWMKDSNGTSLWIMNLKDGSVSNLLYFPGDLYKAFSNPGYSGDTLAWSPDGEGWLIHGAIFVDRKRKQVTWALKPVPNVFSRAQVFLTGDSLITQTDSAMEDAKGNTLYDRKPFLVTVPLPREEIQQSLAAYDSKSEAYLGVGQQVSLEVNVGEIKFGKPDEVKSILSDVITQRLKTEGFEVAADQPIVFKIEYQEQAGNTLQLAKNVKPSVQNPLGRVATGQTLETTAALFELSWIDQESQKTLWSKKVAINPRVLFLREATAEGARTEMFENLQGRLRAELIPYFIPKDDKLKMLPFEIELPD